MIMRDFFKEELEALERKTGLKQYEKILAQDKWEVELKELLDELCRVCNQFDYIPNEDKAKIIRQNIITDQEFIGFNSRIIYKWLSGSKAIYFKEQAHQKQPEEYKSNPERNLLSLLQIIGGQKELDEVLLKNLTPEQLKELENTRALSGGFMMADNFGDKMKQQRAKREFQDLLNRLSSEFYKNRETYEVKTYEDDKGFYVLAENEIDAEEIYKMAKKD